MALQSIGLGSAADDGTGDTLRAAGTKVNENFDEVYTLLGDGTTLSSGISSSATVITLASPALSGSVTGTYTLAGTPTITSPSISGPTFTGILSIADGAVGAPSITNTGDTDTGIYFSAADEVSITTGGSQRLSVSSAGVVALTATTEASATTTAALTTAGGIGVVKDMWIGDDIVMDSDSCVLKMGDSQDLTLTHTADVSLTLATAGSTTGLIVNNTATDGDPYLSWALSGTQTFTMGIDDGESDYLKIGTTAVGTSTVFTLDSSGNLTVGGALSAASINDTLILSGTNSASANAGSDLTLDSSASGIDVGSRILAENGTVDNFLDPSHEKDKIATVDKVLLNGYGSTTGVGDALLNETGGHLLYDQHSAVSIGRDVQGDVAYNDGSSWTSLPPGTSGYFLKTQGSSANPTWAKSGGGAWEFVSRQTWAGVTVASINEEGLTAGTLYKWVFVNMAFSGGLQPLIRFGHGSTTYITSNTYEGNCMGLDSGATQSNNGSLQVYGQLVQVADSLGGSDDMGCSMEINFWASDTTDSTQRPYWWGLGRGKQITTADDMLAMFGGYCSDSAFGTSAATSAVQIVNGASETFTDGQSTLYKQVVA